MYLLAKWYLLGLSLYHLWTGLVSYFAPGFALRFYRRFYGCDPIEQRHLRIILRPWGALAVFTGLAGLAAFADPSGQRATLAALALLLLMRLGYRIGLRRELKAISGIAAVRNWLNVVCLAGGTALLSIAWWHTMPPVP